MTSLAGIQPEQGPPLAVPLGFFLNAPLALVSAGVFFLVRGADGAASAWSTTSVAAVHFGTVGFFLLVMVGALYQMLPVVVGAVIAGPRLGHVVNALLVLGAIALITGQATAAPRAFAIAAVLVSSATALFLAPACAALARAPTRTPTAVGIGVALVALALVVLAGARLALVRAGFPMVVESWSDLRTTHACVGVLGWIGGLLSAVSFQVLPMFFLAPAPPTWLARTAISALTLSVLALGLASVGLSPVDPAILALPGAIAVWLLVPAWGLLALRKRRRKRRDPSLRFFWLGLVAAPMCFLLSMATAFAEDARWPLALGLAVLWGWAGAIAHGMLLRIVPFLLWLHLCAPRVGESQAGHAEPPSARELVTDRVLARQFVLHTLSLIAGGAAVASGSATAHRALGAALVVCGGGLAHALVMAVLRALPRAVGATVR